MKIHWKSDIVPKAQVTSNKMEHKKRHYSLVHFVNSLSHGVLHFLLTVSY